MIKYYCKKIKNGVINQKTNKAWTIDDVPTLWRDDVVKTLEEDIIISKEEA